MKKEAKFIGQLAVIGGLLWTSNNLIPAIHNFFFKASIMSLVDLGLFILLICGWEYNRMSIKELNVDFETKINSLHKTIKEEYTEAINSHMKHIKEDVTEIKNSITRMEEHILELYSKSKAN